jgi:predicted nuclease of restriction endonuclease-like RecB superfamily
VRFSLQDVKKQVHRRKGELAVSLHFLRPGGHQSEIGRLLAYCEDLLGQPQRTFSRDEARARVGDYRLADCLIATLSAWYSWQQPAWEQLMQGYGDTVAALLEIDAITSPTHLRLALYSHVNTLGAGFVDSRTRTSVLETFAGGYQLSMAQLEYLLALDTEEEEVLVRETAQPPTVQDVATLYNQWAFEAALFNASSVRFVIDCAAFEQESETGSGVGAVIKRLCYLARKRGVYYDISYDNDEGAINRAPTHLRLTLYGPQEMTGAAQQYGLRLAQLCRLLLGYRQKTGSALLPAKAILEAEATVHFLQRAYNFAITHNVLSLLPPLPSLSATGETSSQESVTTVPVPSASTAAAIFDSSIEHIFAETFASLETSYAVDGWSLVREPEPLLLESSIFIPDFALTRDARRIYMEILGFWTPSYRERKVQKLQQLQERGDIVLAIPVEAREAFAAIADHFPIVYYDGRLLATDVLQLLRTHFDDVAQRLATIDHVAVREQVLRDGWIAERTCYALLHCYRRSELARAAGQIVVDETMAFVPGIGFYTRDWLEHLRVSFVEWVGVMGIVPLADVLRECRARWPQFATCEDATLEALFSLWPEVQVKRASIFDATIAIEGTEDARAAAIPDEEALVQQAPVKKVVRERKAPYKKRPVAGANQGDLWA